MKYYFLLFACLFSFSCLYAQEVCRLDKNHLEVTAYEIVGSSYRMPVRIDIYTVCKPAHNVWDNYYFTSTYYRWDSLVYRCLILTYLYVNDSLFTGYLHLLDSGDGTSFLLQFEGGLCGDIDTVKFRPKYPIPAAYKPVLYLYPPQKQEIKVELQLTERNIFAPYPAYKNGWEVIAQPDGTLVNQKTGKSHYCLFWEMEGKPIVDKIDNGFVVKGDETAAFLEEKLLHLGLTEKEANEFIIFWLPQMLKNPYNLIHFATDSYEKTSKLLISPKPDTQIRIMMLWQPLSQFQAIPLQVLPPSPIRKGFTAVEWGGARIEGNRNIFVY